MKTKIVPLIIAVIITVVIMLFATKPGTIFNMIGYSIALSIIPEKSSFAINHEDLIFITWAILCGMILLWVVHKIVRIILKNR